MNKAVLTKVRQLLKTSLHEHNIKDMKLAYELYSKAHSLYYEAKTSKDKTNFYHLLDEISPNSTWRVDMMTMQIEIENFIAKYAAEHFNKEACNANT